MKKPKRKKPKFRVGEVVWCSLCRTYDRIASFDPAWDLYILSKEAYHKNNGHTDLELRSLNKRERDQ